MVRSAIHFPLKPFKQESILRRVIRRIIFGPPRPVVVQTVHILKPETTAGAKNTANAVHRAKRASSTHRQTTLHFSKGPQVLLERLVVFTGAFVVTGCVAYWALSRDQVVLTHRQRTMAFSWGFERRFFADKPTGVEVATSSSRIDPKFDVRAQVAEEIAKRILEAMAREFPSIYKELEWNIEVQENSSVNAFYRPGGCLTINSGIIDMITAAEIRGELKSSRDALALVIAHELAHGTSPNFSEEQVVGHVTLILTHFVDT